MKYLFPRATEQLKREWIKYESDESCKTKKEGELSMMLKHATHFLKCRKNITGQSDDEVSEQSHHRKTKQTMEITRKHQDTHSRHDNEEGFSDNEIVKEEVVAWRRRGPEVSHLRWVWSLKSGRNQALCWKEDTVPKCQHSQSPQVTHCILTCHRAMSDYYKCASYLAL